MRFINEKEGFLPIEVIGFETIDGELYVNLQSLDVSFSIIYRDFIRSMSKNWKKISD